MSHRNKFRSLVVTKFDLTDNISRQESIIHSFVLEYKLRIIKIEMKRSFSPHLDSGKPPLGAELRKKILQPPNKRDKHFDLVKLAAWNQANRSMSEKSSRDNSLHSNESGDDAKEVPGDIIPRQDSESMSMVSSGDGTDQNDDVVRFADHDKRKMDLAMQKIRQLLTASGVTLTALSNGTSSPQISPEVNGTSPCHRRTDSFGSVDSAISSITECSYSSQVSVIQLTRSKSIPECNCQSLMPSELKVDKSADDLYMLDGAKSCGLYKNNKSVEMTPPPGMVASAAPFQTLRSAFRLSLSSSFDSDHVFRDRRCSDSEISTVSSKRSIFPYLFRRRTQVVPEDKVTDNQLLEPCK